MKNIDEFQIICENIRYLRQYYGLSRTAMAKKLHISLKNLDLLEAGIFPQRIGICFLYHACQAFGIHQKDLVSIRLSKKTNEE